MRPPFAVILPAAGQSSRFAGKEKKPFVNLDGRPVWLRTAECFVARPEVKQTLVVVAPEDMEMFRRRYAPNVMFLNIQIIEGGSERFESVANALAQLEDDIEFVAIHDAVRPCVPASLVDALFDAAINAGAAIPALAVVDTLKRATPEMLIESTILREGLWRAQTPQVFRKDWLIEAYAQRSAVSGSITDDAQLVEAIGKPVKLVPGSTYNLKITTSEDLDMAELFIKNRRLEAPVKPTRPFDDERFS